MTPTYNPGTVVFKAISAPDPAGPSLSLAVESGARIDCVFQRLAGEAASEGLWITSHGEDSAAARFKLTANSTFSAHTVITVRCFLEHVPFHRTFDGIPLARLCNDFLVARDTRLCAARASKPRHGNLDRFSRPHEQSSHRSGLAADAVLPDLQTPIPDYPTCPDFKK